MTDILGLLFIAAAMFFFMAGSIGLLRLPDVHSRLHALTKADNVGLGLLMVGASLLGSDPVLALKLLLVWLLVMAASSASAHLIARQVPSGSRVATSFPAITRRFFDELGVDIEIAPVSGATEIAPHLGFDEAACEAAVTRAHWPARMQRLRRGPLVEAAPAASSCWSFQPRCRRWAVTSSPEASCSGRPCPPHGQSQYDISSTVQVSE